MRKPLAVAEDLENRYPETNLIFSPDEKSILTGVSPARAGEKGSVVFLNGDDLKEERRVAIGEGAVVRVLWHSRINQVCLSRVSILQYGEVEDGSGKVSPLAISLLAARSTNQTSLGSDPGRQGRMRYRLWDVRHRRAQEDKKGVQPQRLAARWIALSVNIVNFEAEIPI